MAKPRAHALALLRGFLAVGSAMFACRGPETAPYERPGTPVEDASQPDAAGSGSTPRDATPTDDAFELSEAQADAYPLSRCAGGLDVFYLDVTGPSGPLQLGEITKTNVEANWFVALQPELNVMLETETGPVGSVQVWTPDSTPAVPGVYPQGPTSKGTSIDIVVVDEACHVTSGTLDVLDLEYDWPDGSSSGDVNSLLLSFDLMCEGNDALRGCIRYSR
jgi:hypothetical protein